MRLEISSWFSRVTQNPIYDSDKSRNRNEDVGSKPCVNSPNVLF